MPRTLVSLAALLIQKWRQKFPRQLRRKALRLRVRANVTAVVVDAAADDDTSGTVLQQRRGLLRGPRNRQSYARRCRVRKARHIWPNLFSRRQAVRRQRPSHGQNRQS